VIDAVHHDYITEILSFNRVTAYEVMTPLCTSFLSREKGIRHVVRLIEETRFSRIPVYEERVDNNVWLCLLPGPSYGLDGAIDRPGV
jgi:CBS domain containing-hemolysin-like protein